MFGLSMREVLQKAIMNASENKLHIYEEKVREMLDKCNTAPNISEEEIQKLAQIARRDYCNEVCDAVKDSLAVSSPDIYTKFNLALMSPSISGLSEEFTIDYLAEFGISGGATFALAYYALTGNPADTIKLHKTMSMLNHYQNDLMDSTIDKYESV